MVRLEVLTTASMKMAVFWELTASVIRMIINPSLVGSFFPFFFYFSFLIYFVSPFNIRSLFLTFISVIFYIRAIFIVSPLAALIWSISSPCCACRLLSNQATNKKCN
jgi:hypothetical protein